MRPRHRHAYEHIGITDHSHAHSLSRLLFASLPTLRWAVHLAPTCVNVSLCAMRVALGCEEWT